MSCEKFFKGIKIAKNGSETVAHLDFMVSFTDCVADVAAATITHAVDDYCFLFPVLFMVIYEKDVVSDLPNF